MKLIHPVRMAGTCGIALAMCLPALAQTTSMVKGRTHIVIPASSSETAADIGVSAHTHLQLAAVPSSFADGTPQATPGLPPFAGYLFETPASIACVYRLVGGHIPGCNPNFTTEAVSGGSKAIAIVDAYDDPNAAADLAYFSKQFGLPAAQFSVVYASGLQPAIDPTGGWEVEESLDIEWAHAMAPNAKIFLVEAKTNSNANLLKAVQVASGIVALAGGGEVSISWGEGEFSTELAYDTYFEMPSVVYVASSGDSSGTSWPSVSANILAAGGTSLSRSLYSGDLVSENAWQDAGGGSSQYVARPPFQRSVAGTVGAARGVPDLSFDANPSTGVWVYDSNPIPTADAAGWYTVGGTSVSAPSLSGIINLAGQFSASSMAENTLIYRSAYNAIGFRDITYGNCGVYMSDFTGTGWDFCTGVGSVRGLNGK